MSALYCSHLHGQFVCLHCVIVNLYVSAVLCQSVCQCCSQSVGQCCGVFNLYVIVVLLSICMFVLCCNQSVCLCCVAVNLSVSVML